MLEPLEEAKLIDKSYFYVDKHRNPVTEFSDAVFIAVSDLAAKPPRAYFLIANHELGPPDGIPRTIKGGFETFQD